MDQLKERDISSINITLSTAKNDLEEVVKNENKKKLENECITEKGRKGLYKKNKREELLRGTRNDKQKEIIQELARHCAWT